MAKVDAKQITQHSKDGGKIKIKKDTLRTMLEKEMGQPGSEGDARAEAYPGQNATRWY